MKEELIVARNEGHPVNYRHFCIDAYVDPDGEWSECPHCKLKPKVWIFDNGRSTACGCWTDRYDHFSIHAESIMSVHKRTCGIKMTEYVTDGLRNNWNHWCETGDVIFEHAGNRDDDLW